MATVTAPEPSGSLRPTDPPQDWLPATAGEARAGVLRLLREYFGPQPGLEDDVVVADALLVTSELITNALVHAGGVTGFATRIADQRLRVAVSDASDRRPATRSDAAFPSPGGFGWPMIQRIAHSVETTTHPTGGKTITVLLPLR